MIPDWSWGETGGKLAGLAAFRGVSVRARRELREMPNLGLMWNPWREGPRATNSRARDADLGMTNGPPSWGGVGLPRYYGRHAQGCLWHIGRQ